MLLFPDSSTIKSHLASSPTLKISFLQRRGIDKAISDLVAERFACQKLEESAVKTMLTITFHDLQKGKDEVSGKSLQTIEMPPLLWNSLRLSLEIDLKKCAIQSKL